MMLWFIVAAAGILAGTAVAVVAGSIATLKHPDATDPKRNARAYVVPAVLGLLVAVLGVLGLILTGVGMAMGFGL